MDSTICEGRPQTKLCFEKACQGAGPLPDRQHCGRPFLARWPTNLPLQLAIREESKRAKTSCQNGLSNCIALKIKLAGARRKNAHGSRSEKSATRGAKDQSRAGNSKISKSSKSGKCVNCLKAHDSGSAKKCDTWAKARRRPIALAMQIHTMLILISQILCVGKIGSRPAPGA